VETVLIEVKGGMTMEDSEIVSLYLRRDETAIRETAGKFGPRLRSLAYNVTQDAQTAEECENDTYLEAWNAIPPHEPRSYLYAFLARITRHLSLNRCRERDSLKRTAYLCELSNELEQCIPGPDDSACRVDDLALGEALNRFLGSLGEEKRAIFLRRYWYLDSISEVAKRFGISQSKVKTTLFRLRGQLRNYLEGEGFTL
jgi:RNA polymerase sigma-70 factor (ECF subfamily)